MPRGCIGWFGEDVWDWATGAAGDVLDTFGEVASVIPFAPELGGALKDLINGPLRDFANTPLGLVVFRAMATTIYGPLAWTIGPQVATLAFAVPGLARGDDFWEAWITELRWRAEETARTLAPSAAEAITPAIRKAAEELVKWVPEQVQALALSELAKRLKVDEWTAAMAGALLGWLPIPKASDFRLDGSLKSLGERSPFEFRAGQLQTSAYGAAAKALAVAQAVGAYQPGLTSTSVVGAAARFAPAPMSAPPPVAVAAPPPTVERSSPVVGVLLVGVATAAAGFAVWRYVR